MNAMRAFRHGGAQNINVAKVQKNLVIHIFYLRVLCRLGYGFDVTNMAGGMLAWEGKVN